MDDERTGRAADVGDLRNLFECKIDAELARAQDLVPGAQREALSGDRFPVVAFVKGSPGPAERRGDPVMSGPDGEAAAKALVRLGFDPASTFAVLSRPVIRSEGGDCISRLRQVLEAIDPALIVGVDEQARLDLSEAFDIDVVFGRATTVLGRTVVAVDGLEASLAEEPCKRRVWRQMQALAPPDLLDPARKRRSQNGAADESSGS